MEKLQNVNFNLTSTIDSFDYETLLTLINAIDVYIKSDRMIFEKSNTNTVVEIRLNRASSILRSIFTNLVCNRKFASLYKPRQSEKFIDLLLKNFTYTPSTGHKQIFDPVILNFIKTLNQLLQLQPFRDHLFSNTFHKIIKITIECLNLVFSETLKSSKNENLTVELLFLFYELLCPLNTSNLNAFTIQACPKQTNYYSNMFQCLVHYFKNIFADSKRERESLIYTFKIINKCLKDLSTSDMKLCYKFYTLGVKFILEIKAINSIKLISELAIFTNLISSFICLPNLNIIKEDNWEFNNLTEPFASNSLITTSTKSDNSDLYPTIITASSEAEESIVMSDHEGDQIVNFNAVSFNKRRRTENDLSSANTHILNELGKVIEIIFNLFHESSLAKQLELSSDSMNLHILPLLEKHMCNWFNLKYVSLARSDDCVAWLLRLGLIKLIISFYELKGYTNDESADIYDRHSLKIQRLSGMKLGFSFELSNTISYFSNPLEFFLTILTDEPFTHPSMNITISQLLVLFLGYISTYGELSNLQKSLTYITTEKIPILDKLLLIFEKQDETMKYWLLSTLNIYYCISCMHYNTDVTKNVDLKIIEGGNSINKLLKYCLELLKDPLMCKNACILLSNVSISSFSNNHDSLHLHRTILQNYENVIDLSEINGPAIICKESVIFWITTMAICKNYKFVNINFHDPRKMYDSQLYSQKITNWVLSKTNQLLSITDVNDIIPILKLILWLSGFNGIKLTRNEFVYAPKKYPEIYSKFIFDENDQLELCNYILQNEITSPEEFITEFLVEADSLVVNDIIKDRLKQFVIHFSERSLLDLNMIPWSIGMIAILSNNELEYSCVLDKLNNSIREKFKAFQNDAQFRSFFRNYLEMIYTLLPLEGLWITRVLDVIPLNQIIEVSLSLISSPPGRVGNSYSNATFDLFDSFMPGESGSNGFPDYSCYNYKSLSCHTYTLEQRVTKLILEYNNHLFDTKTAFEAAFKFTERVKSKFRFMATQYEIFKFIESKNANLSEEILDTMYGQLTSLLEDHLTKTSECAIVIICKFFSRFCKIWMYTTHGIHSDGKAVYEFMNNLHQKEMLHTELSLVEYFKLSVNIFQCLNASVVDFDGSLLLEMLTKCFTSIGNLNKNQVAPQIMSLIKERNSEMLKFYTIFLKAFKNPQNTIETSATFCRFMTIIANASEPLVIATICNLLELSNYAQIKRYLGIAITQITVNNNISSVQRLFWNFKEVFFKCWEGFGLPVEQFPFDLFQFPSRDLFMLRTYKEIAALSLAYNHTETVQRIAKLINMKESSIVNDSLSLSITLSWTPSGVKNKIFKIFEKYYASSKALRSGLTDQFILITFQLFRFCDLSSEKELLNIFTGRENLNLFSIDAPVLLFLHEYEIYVKPKNCVDMINYFGEICGISDIWSVPIVYHLSSKILLLIDSSILKLEKLVNLRRLKFLLMLATDGLKNSSICYLLTKSLTSYLGEDYLREDAAIILNFMLEQNSDTLSNISVKSWITLLHALNSYNSVNITKICNTIGGLKNNILLGGYSQMFQFGFETIFNNNATNIPNIPEYVNSASKDAENTKTLILFLSLLFKKSSSLKLYCFNIKPESLTPIFIQNIFDIKIKYSNDLSDVMIQWVGKTLALYYQTTGKSPQQNILEFDSYILQEANRIDFNKEVRFLDFIFKLMIKDLPISSLRSTHCFETIVGVIIYKHSVLAEKLISFSSYNELFESFELFIYPMSNYAGSLSIDQVEIEILSYYKCSLEQTLNGFSTIIKVSKFDKWLAQILFSIINELSAQSSIIILLANYICHIPSFILKCFCPLVIYFVQNETYQRGNYISRMIVEFFEEDIQNLSKEAIILFIELVLLIRIGTKNGNEKFIRISKRFDYPRICQAAHYVGKNKAALMLYEDYYTNIDVISKELILNDPTYNIWLKRFYSGIEDNDLIFGLPIVSDFENGLQILKNNNIKWGEMMFNNARFESELQSNDYKSNRSFYEIIDGMMDMGWSGVSKIMSEYSSKVFINNEHMLDDVLYAQSWKLNQWDFAAPANPTNENEFIYSIMKQIKETPRSSVQISDNMMKKLVTLDLSLFQSPKLARTESLESWMRTLSICNNIRDTVGIDDTVFDNHMLEFSKSTVWFRDATVNQFENILLAQRAILQIMNHFGTVQHPIFGLNEKKCWIGIINNLHIYNSIMTEKLYTQKAINFSVYLNQISGTMFGVDNPFIERIAKYNIARAFWTQQSDTRFPIDTLKGIINKDKVDQITFKSIEESKVSYISTEFLMATLAKWCDESKQDTPSAIMDKYIDPTMERMSNIPETTYGDLGLTYHIMAKFCDKQISNDEDDKSFEKLSQSIKNIENDIRSVGKFIKDETTKEKKRYALQDLNRLKIRHRAQSKELSAARSEQDGYIKKAISFYFKAIAFGNHAYIETDVDRFCSLWIEYNDINLEESELLSLPAYNFVPWCNQLVSRLLDESSNFQNLLRKLIITLALEHPFHVLYLLKSLIITRKESEDAAADSRGRVAGEIWSTLSTTKERFNVDDITDVLHPIESFSDNAVEIANVKLKNTNKVTLTKLPNSKWWLETLPTESLPSPVKRIAISKHKPYRKSELSLIIRISDTVMVASSGVSHPKIMKMLLSTGEHQRILLKAPDDLRQDSIMTQVFEKVNVLFWKDIETRKRNLRIRTYNVLPLGPTSGVLEFVPNSMPLIEILKSLHNEDEMDINTARLKIKEVQNQSKSVRYQVYKDICKRITPNLRTFFFNNFTSSDLWFKSRSLYCHGIATTSITGYILGIGDRHCNNILLDKSSGEPIHIDFGVAFDQGKVLPIPETVPFRLTRDIVDGMGITDVNGMFSKSCEHVLRVLRNNSQYICDILDVLKYDPLYSWTLSPLRKKKLQQMYFNNEGGDLTFDEFVKTDIGSEANTAIETVKKKLEAKGLSNEAVVRELIREAIDPKNLALLFMGWSSFL